MRYRLFALLILPTAALIVLAAVVVVDRNVDYDSARTSSSVARLAENVARVDQALGDEALRAAQLVGAAQNPLRAPWTGPNFQTATESTDRALDRLEALLDDPSYNHDLATAVLTIRATLAYRSDIVAYRVSSLQVNDRYAYIRDLLLDALATQATVLVDAEGQQQIVALIALIETRADHLDERLVVELALTYESWAPGQHAAAISSVASQRQRIEFANRYFDRQIVPPPILTTRRDQIAASEVVPDLSPIEWGAMSDSWLRDLTDHIETERQAISIAAAEAETYAAAARLATLVGVGLAVGLTLSLTAAVAYRLVRRVSIITEQAKQMADGYPAARTFPQVRGGDELGQLALAFDEMISQVDQRANNQIIESTALEAIAQGEDLASTLDRIALLLGVDDRGAPRYRFVVDGDGDPLIVANDDRVTTVPNDALTRTALSLVATAKQRAIDHQRLAWQARHDDLTGLLNRGAIIEALFDAQRVDRPGERARRPALLYVDLDLFKAINDDHGHAGGDLVLTTQADRLTEFAEAVGGSVGRFGGDEFLAVVPDVDSESTMAELADGLVATLSEPIAYRDTVFVVAVSLGAAHWRAGVEPLQLLNEADAALYEAKKQGRGQAIVSTEELRQRARQDEQLRQEVLAAFANDEFAAWYQPLWGDGGRTLVGLEALVRWQHPERGTLSPDVFIPVVEELRLLSRLDGLLFELVCHQMTTWLEAGLDLHQVHVNMSTERIEDPDFVDDTRASLARSGCPPERIVAEVTESGLMTDTRTNSHRLQALRDLGIRIAVDDFGQGYSSLAYLSDLPVDVLKIDRRFVDHIDTTEANQAIVSAVIELGQRLNLMIVAEGLERPEELDYLVAAGSQLFQGFLLARPAPTPETTALLGRRRAPTIATTVMTTTSTSMTREVAT